MTSYRRTFRILGLRPSRAWDLEFRVKGLGSRVLGLGPRV